jgi:hypothetical protein
VLAEALTESLAAALAALLHAPGEQVSGLVAGCLHITEEPIIIEVN